MRLELVTHSRNYTQKKYTTLPPLVKAKPVVTKIQLEPPPYSGPPPEENKKPRVRAPESTRCLSTTNRNICLPQYPPHPAIPTTREATLS